MSPNWQKAISELKEYIAGNPKIEISHSVIAIPGDVRSEFYRLFDTVRVAFLKEKFQNLLDEAILLSKNYAEVAPEVTKSLGLSEVKLPADLNWFLNDPINGLIRPLFDPLFNLLKGRIDTDSFEKEASRWIETSYSKLFRSGYEKWVAFSLLTLLVSDRALMVSIEDLQTTHETHDSGGELGITEEPVPKPKEVKLLSLEHVGAEPVFIVPNLIVHSAKADRYVSIRAELTEAWWTAKEVSGNREWHHIRQVGRRYTPRPYWPDFVIHVDDKAEELALVADFSRFLRPDMIVECMEQPDWYQQGGLERVKSNHDFLKPRLGSYVVSRLPVPEEAFKELMPEPAAAEPAKEGSVSGEIAPEQISGQPAPQEASGEPVSASKPLPEEEPEKPPLDIHILTVGYDRSQLAAIINALLPSTEAIGETEGQ